LVQRTFISIPLTKDLYSKGGKISSKEESLAEKPKTAENRKISM